MKNFKRNVLALQNKIPQLEFINQRVSTASVGWHIEHSLLTINLIIETLQKSNPKDYEWKFNFPRLLVFTMNKIPRGKAKSPDIVQPKDDISIDSLKNKIDVTSKKINELNQLNSNHFFMHPYFGKLNLEPTIKFLEINTKHHLDIINEIVKSNA